MKSKGVKRISDSWEFVKSVHPFSRIGSFWLNYGYGWLECNNLHVMINIMYRVTRTITKHLDQSINSEFMVYWYDLIDWSHNRFFVQPALIFYIFRYYRSIFVWIIRISCLSCGYTFIKNQMCENYKQICRSKKSLLYKDDYHLSVRRWHRISMSYIIRAMGKNP